MKRRPRAIKDDDRVVYAGREIRGVVFTRHGAHIAANADGFEIGAFETEAQAFKAALTSGPTRPREQFRNGAP
jgi:hypothetical protein